MPPSTRGEDFRLIFEIGVEIEVILIFFGGEKHQFAVESERPTCERANVIRAQLAVEQFVGDAVGRLWSDLHDVLDDCFTGCSDGHLWSGGGLGVILYLIENQVSLVRCEMGGIVLAGIGGRYRDRSCAHRSRLRPLRPLRGQRPRIRPHHRGTKRPSRRLTS